MDLDPSDATEALSPGGSSTTIVLAAHGSRAVDANDAHRALAHALDRRVADEVRPAFLELSEPSIPDAIDAAIADGAAEVVVLPYFLHPGRHLRDDIPGLVDSASARHPGRAIVLAPAFGDDHAVIDVLVDQVHRAVAPGPPSS